MTKVETGSIKKPGNYASVGFKRKIGDLGCPGGTVDHPKNGGRKRVESNPLSESRRGDGTQRLGDDPKKVGLG